jgi:ABC-type uncharacterized transport system permease subunit
MDRVSVLCFFASYSVALVCELWRRRKIRSVGRWLGLAMTVAGLVAQSWYLVNRSREASLPPLLSSMHDWLLVLTWLMVVVYLFITLTSRDLAIGVVVWPVVLALITTALFSSQAANDNVNVHRNWTMLHVVLLVFGVAAVLIGHISSLLYLWQHHRLKERPLGRADWALPSLETLTGVNRWSMLLSVPLITVGMMIGAGLTWSRQRHRPDETWWNDPVIMASVVGWLLLAAVAVWLLRRQHTSGRQIAMLTAWTTGVLLLALSASQVLVGTTQSASLHGVSSLPTEIEPSVAGEAVR